jgi:hypothetical protein
MSTDTATARRATPTRICNALRGHEAVCAKATCLTNNVGCRLPTDAGDSASGVDFELAFKSLHEGQQLLRDRKIARRPSDVSCGSPRQSSV